MSDSDDADAPEAVPSDAYGVIYTEAANLEAGRAPDFGRRAVDAARLREFDEVFGTKDKILELVSRAAGGRLRKQDMALRTVAWRLMLGVLPFDAEAEDGGVSLWPAALREKRDEYTMLLAKYKLDPSKVDESDSDPLLCNPLSLDKASPWQQFYANQALLHTIELDVKRLYPDGCDVFFDAAPVRAAMINALFLWCRMHPTTSYRQGMHEVMAPLMFALEKDKVRPTDVAGDLAESPLAAVLDARGVEADMFWLFAAIMDDLEPLFASDSAGGSSSGSSNSGSDSDEEEEEAKASIVVDLGNKVQTELLGKVDPPLAKALATLGIQPQVYCLRWMRLMFLREFHIEEVLAVWDGLFAAKFGTVVLRGAGRAKGPAVSLLTSIEAMSVTMLLFIRDGLIGVDYCAALMQLMKFPPMEGNVHVLLERATELRVTDYRPTAPPAVTQLRSPSPQSFGSNPSPAPSLGHASVGAGGGVADGAGAGFVSTPAASPHGNARLRLIKFYTEHNPAKLVEVDTILAKYRGREDKLFAALRKRYNLPAEHAITPPPAFTPAPAPAAPAPAPAPRRDDSSGLHLFSGSWGSAGQASRPAPPVPPRRPVAAPSRPAEVGGSAEMADQTEVMELCGARIEAMVGLGADALPFLQEIADVLLGRKDVTTCDWFD